jgi:hypothetical protein
MPIDEELGVLLRLASSSGYPRTNLRALACGHEVIVGPALSPFRCEQPYVLVPSFSFKIVRLLGLIIVHSIINVHFWLSVARAPYIENTVEIY